ncbi:MAG TPA: HAD hydrolase-like protein [Campylobacter avium]|nr:HAD hydrolase-like protein [Campylobacter avium]
MFDTLLLRPYCMPKDVFLHLEECFYLKGFAKARAEAEKRAYILLNKENPNYDEIYACIPKIYQKMKEKERELELQTIYINPQMKIVFENLIKEGKKVIFTTDMYYDESFFKELFKKHNINGYHKIYISSQVSKSKYKGDLYEFISEDLGIKADDILHVGDNYHVDYIQALCNGFESIHLISPLLKFFEAFPMLKEFHTQNNNLTASIMIGILLKKWLESDKNIDDYWEYFGYFYGGPICYGLSKFVYDEARKEDLKEFIFVARDGYTIEKIFNLLQKQFNTDIKTVYLYANRLIYDICFFKNNITEDKDDKLKNFVVSASKDIKKLENINISKMSSKKIKKILNDNIKEFETVSESILKKYNEYLENFDLKEDRIALFDIATISASSYNLLSKLYPKKTIFAYYLMVLPHYKHKINFVSYKTNAFEYELDDLLEFIISAPSFPVKEIRKTFNFVFIDNKFEEYRKSVYKDVSKHELSFATDLINIFKNYEVSFCADTLLNQIKNFTININSEDEHYFRNIYHSHDHTFKNYRRIKINYKNYILDNSQQIMIKNIGAVSLIKSHLSYKLGEQILSVKNTKIKILILPFTLIYIYIRHFSSKGLNKLLIDTNPNLKNLPLHLYSDYQEALKIKNNQLTYRLGNLLVKHPFTFLFRVNKVYKEWKEQKGK